MLRVVGLVIAISCLWIPTAHAAARYRAIEELVAASDVIAVIEVTKTERAGDGIKRGYWEYAQKNVFRFIDLIKSGDFVAHDPKVVHVLWAQKSFICANASYRSGVYVVFLQSVGSNEWVTLNHSLGALPVEGDGNVLRFGWYLPTKNRKARVSVFEARATISNAILDGKSVSFEASVHPNWMRNEWNPDAPSQRLWFIVHQKPEATWPDRLSFVGAFFAQKAITKQKYQAIVKQGGRYRIKASWVDGYLVIDTIERVGDSD